MKLNILFIFKKKRMHAWSLAALMTNLKDFLLQNWMNGNLRILFG